MIELEDADVGALLARGEAGLAAARSATGSTRPLAGLDLAPVIVDPPKIICVGQNYLAHIREQNAKVPEYPTLFNKFRRTLIGPNDEIVLPRVSENVDWEVELVIVIGRTARHVSGAAAEDAIFGYTVMNDTSIRDYQFRTTQWMQGKAFEASTPLGPVVVSRDELDPSDLRLWTEVEGVVMQDSTTADLVFKPAELVAYCSEIITLEPGDVIATGTPSGVGQWRNPPLFLQPGQTIRCSVEGIGALTNRAVKEA
ncbi:MAG TPA: fumarylacetoacetate hydrolase family protein [Candidatus Dormibacteraeota bacterium]|nr:fumarylacetoacetate hydrolase family protein [Candidatus Dormibacteraeota bacterium]